MIKKILTLLVIVLFLGMTTSFAYDRPDDFPHHGGDNHSVDIIAAVTVVVILIAVVFSYGHYYGPVYTHYYYYEPLYSPHTVIVVPFRRR